MAILGVEPCAQEVHVTSDTYVVANNSDIVFPPAARRAQAERSSAGLYAKRIAAGFPDRISSELAGFIAGLDTAFLATVSAAGAPYIQHRGGPKGFIKVLDERTLGFADYAGNRQYITISNLADNDRAFLFLLDFAARRRIKIWGRARVVENDPALLTRLADLRYRAARARDPVHGRSVVADATVMLREQIAALEAENARLRARTMSSELRESEAAARA
jgi:uncharacterized protein